VRSFPSRAGCARSVVSEDRAVGAAPIRADRDSSLGVVNYRPSVDMKIPRPLPVSTLARESCLPTRSLLRTSPGWRGSPPSARRCHSPGSFRPCRSSRLRRFAPQYFVQVCCALQPTMGFATFQDHRFRVSRRFARNRRAPAFDFLCGSSTALCIRCRSRRVSEEYGVLGSFCQWLTLDRVRPR